MTETVYTKKEYTYEVQMKIFEDQIKDTNTNIKFYEASISGKESQKRGMSPSDVAEIDAIIMIHKTKLEEYKAQLVDIQRQMADFIDGDKPTEHQ